MLILEINFIDDKECSMPVFPAYKNQFQKSSGKNKKDFNLMIEAVAMVALKQKRNVKKWNSDEIIEFIKKNKNEVWEELRILERSKKATNDDKNMFRRN